MAITEETQKTINIRDEKIGSEGKPLLNMDDLNLRNGTEVLEMVVYKSRSPHHRRMIEIEGYKSVTALCEDLRARFSADLNLREGMSTKVFIPIQRGKFVVVEFFREQGSNLPGNIDYWVDNTYSGN